jgi:hypothetical protein
MGEGRGNVGTRERGDEEGQAANQASFRFPRSLFPSFQPFEAKKKPGDQGSPGFEEEAGDGLLSHHLAVAVPSALQGLTAVFGMGTGVAPAR